MERIEAFHVDKNIIYEEQKFKNSNFEFFCSPLSHVLSLLGHNFCSQAPIEKKNP